MRRRRIDVGRFRRRRRRLEFFADLLALWNAGACAIPLDARLTPFEIETLETLLIESDFGVTTSLALVADVEFRAKRGEVKTEAEFRGALAKGIEAATGLLMPEVLAGFVKVYPDARVEIRSALSAELYDAVIRGVREVAFEQGSLVVVTLGAAIVRALQGAGVAACTKHFPGHGDTAVVSPFRYTYIGFAMLSSLGIASARNT